MRCATTATMSAAVRSDARSVPDCDRLARASDRHLELVTGSKRQARSTKEKAAIVAEAFAPGANVMKIRRHHGLLFSWRRQVRRARASPVAAAASEGEQVLARISHIGVGDEH